MEQSRNKDPEPTYRSIYHQSRLREIRLQDYNLYLRSKSGFCKGDEVNVSGGKARKLMGFINQIKGEGSVPSHICSSRCDVMPEKRSCRGSR